MAMLMPPPAIAFHFNKNFIITLRCSNLVLNFLIFLLLVLEHPAHFARRHPVQRATAVRHAEESDSGA